MDNSLTNLVSQSQSVMILLPNNPVFDEVAAGLSLYLTLKNQKNVSIVCTTPMIVEFNRLIGVDKIQNSMGGGSDMVITLKDYKAEAVDRVRADIDNGVFKLTVITKTGEKPPVRDNVVVDEAGTTADLVLAIGGGAPQDFMALTSPQLINAAVAHIGFKAMPLTVSSNKFFPFNKPVASTSEVVASMIKESQWVIDADIATNLLAGIEVESAAFTSQYVTADTFQMVSDLIKAGGKKGAALPQINPQGKYPAGSLPQNWGQLNQQQGAVSTNPANTNPFANMNSQPQPVEATQVQQAQMPQQPVNPAPVTGSNADNPQEADNPPQEWLNTPKIFTGTSVS